MNPVQIIQVMADLVGGLLSLGGDVVGTAVGAVMGFVGSVVDGLAEVAASLVALLPEAGDLGLEIPAGFVLGWSIFNTFLPLTETFAMLGVLVLASIAPIVWHLGITVYHLIPKPFVGT